MRRHVCYLGCLGLSLLDEIEPLVKARLSARGFAFSYPFAGSLVGIIDNVETVQVVTTLIFFAPSKPVGL